MDLLAAIQRYDIFGNAMYFTGDILDQYCKTAFLIVAFILLDAPVEYIWRYSVGSLALQHLTTSLQTLKVAQSQ